MLFCIISDRILLFKYFEFGKAAGSNPLESAACFFGGPHKARTGRDGSLYEIVDMSEDRNDFGANKRRIGN
jgi:hypothetical protein